MTGYRLYRLGAHGLGLCDIDTGRIVACDLRVQWDAICEDFLMVRRDRIHPGPRAAMICDIPASCHPATLAAIKTCAFHAALTCEVWDVLPDAGAFNLQGGM